MQIISNFLETSLCFVFSKCFILWYMMMGLFGPKYFVNCRWTANNIYVVIENFSNTTSQRFRPRMVNSRRWKRERPIGWLAGIVLEHLNILSNWNIYITQNWPEIQSAVSNSKLYTKHLARNSIYTIKFKFI